MVVCDGLLGVWPVGKERGGGEKGGDYDLSSPLLHESRFTVTFTSKDYQKSTMSDAVVPGTTSTGITWVFSGILKDGTWNPIEYGLTSSVRRR
jgi:hypothetical protein